MTGYDRWEERGEAKRVSKHGSDETSETGGGTQR